MGRDAGRQQLVDLQNQLLKSLTAYSGKVTTVEQGIAQLRHSLAAMPCLLVIDDIWSEEQLEALLVAVGPGSRVVLTSRDSAVFETAMMPVELWSIDELQQQEATELFCWHAFLNSQPPAEWSSSVTAVVAACGGLPLSLEVVGAHLYRKARLEQWEEALAILQQAGNFSSRTKKLFARLRLSVDDLPQEEQTIFLDLACVLLGFVGPATFKSTAKYIWGRGADTRLENLASKSLIKLDRAGAVVMHDQLRDLGRAMVSAVQPPWQRSHLWESTALDTLLNHAQV